MKTGSGPARKLRTRLLPGAFPALVTSTLAVMQYSPLFQCGSIRDNSCNIAGAGGQTPGQLKSR